MPDVIHGMSNTYNTNSTIQKSAVQLSFDFIEQGVDALDVPQINIIADYGSSQGANSILGMKKIIDCLRNKKKINKDPLVIHNDLPTNDWSALFQLLNNDKSYHGVASGRSFYEQCLPSNSLSVGFSSTAIHWLSKKPCDIVNHCFSDRIENPKVYKLYQEQAFLDYSNFLKHRSTELISGGILILVILSGKREGKSEYQCIYDLLYECAQLLPMTTDELMKYTIPMYFRSYEECLNEELFNQYSFRIINSRNTLVQSPIYKQLEDKDITKDEFARLYTAFVRGWSESIVEQALINSREEKDIHELVNRFWNIYEEKLRENPEKGNISNNYTYIILKKT